ncbi:hypothetical protein ABK040_014933 [Willaertia magna]
MKRSGSIKHTQVTQHGFYYRPLFEKVIQNDATKAVFRKFCQTQFVEESLECLEEVEKVIKNFKEHEQLVTTLNEMCTSATPTPVDEPRSSMDLIVDDKDIAIHPEDSKSVTSPTLEKDGSFLGFLTGSHKNKEKIEISIAKLQKKIVEELNNFVGTFIKEDAPKQTNIDSYSRKQVCKQLLDIEKVYGTAQTPHTDDNTSNGSSGSITSTQLQTSKTLLPLIEEMQTHILNVECQLLLLLKTDVFPRFIRHPEWKTFVDENPKIAKTCLQEEDANLIAQLRYKKEHLERLYTTDHDLKFLDFVTEDQACYELASHDTTTGLSVYISKGNDFVDEKDIGNGGFSCLKAIGYLPIPAEAMFGVFLSERFNTALHPNMIFDKVDYLESDMNGGVKENGDKYYPYRLGRGHFDFKFPFGVRTTMNVVTNSYYKGRYFSISRGSLGGDYSHYLHTKDGKVKKTTRFCTLSFMCYTPISPTKCHFIHVTMLNPGGILSRLSSLLTKKMAADFGEQYHQNVVDAVSKIVKSDFEGIEKEYNSVVESYIAFLKYTNEKVEKSIQMPETFEAFKQKFNYLKEHCDKLEKLRPQQKKK